MLLPTNGKSLTSLDSPSCAKPTLVKPGIYVAPLVLVDKKGGPFVGVITIEGTAPIFTGWVY